MKIDLYTKTVLTGILGCLFWLCAVLTPISTPVQAQFGPTSVIIAGYSATGGVQGMDRGLPVTVLSGGATASSPALPLPSVPAPVAAIPPAPAPTSTAPVQRAATRCQATTKKGAQCSRMAKAGGSYCWQHGG